MFNWLKRTFRGDEGQDTAQGAEAAPGISQRRLDSLRRSAEAEAATPAMADSPQRPASSAVPTVAAFKPHVAEDPVAKAKRLVPIVMGIENKAVRAFLIACAQDENPEWTAERRERHATALEAAILTGDPLDVALDLYARLPARRGLPNPDGELRRLNCTFDVFPVSTNGTDLRL